MHFTAAEPADETGSGAVANPAGDVHGRLYFALLLTVASLEWYLRKKAQLK